MKEQAEKHIPLYLITGFLGSGKTSVINHLLDEFAGKRIGLVLNDFGQIEVDSSLVPTSGKIHTKGLHGGQIFCSCLSGSFIDTVLEFSDFDPDLVLVETSGLSQTHSVAGDHLIDSGKERPSVLLPRNDLRDRCRTVSHPSHNHC